MSSSVLDLASQRLKKLNLFCEHKKPGSIYIESPVEVEKKSVYKPMSEDIQDLIKQIANENILHKYNNNILTQLKADLAGYINIKYIESSNIFISPDIYNFYESLFDIFLQKDQMVYLYATTDFNYSEEVKYINSGKIVIEDSDQAVKSLLDIYDDIQNEDYKIVVICSQCFNEQELKDFVDMLPENIVLILRTSNPVAFNYYDYFNKTVLVLREFPAITTMVEPPLCFAISRASVIELLNSIQLPNNFNTISLLVGRHFTKYDNPVTYDLKPPKNYYKGYDEILSSLIRENVGQIKQINSPHNLLSISMNLNLQQEELFDFASDEHFLGISEDLKFKLQEIVKAEGSFNYYSNKMTLRKLIASYCSSQNNDFEYTNIMLGAGVTSLLDIITKAFVNDGDGYKKLYKDKTFTIGLFPDIYSRILLKRDTINEIIPLNEDFSADIEQLIKKINRVKPKLVLIDNPRVNTGAIIEKTDFEKILNNLPDETILVVDESFYKFAEYETGDFLSAVNYIKDHPNLIVLRSFSYLNAFAGLRFGYVVANEQLITLMNSVRNPFDISPITISLAIKAFDNIDIFEAVTLKFIQEQRNIICKELSEMGLFYLKSYTNSVLFSSPYSSNDLQEVLLPYKIIIKPLDGNYARLSISDQYRNDYFIKCLKSILAGQLHN